MVETRRTKRLRSRDSDGQRGRSRPFPSSSSSSSSFSGSGGGGARAPRVIPRTLPPPPERNEWRKQQRTAAAGANGANAADDDAHGRKEEETFHEAGWGEPPRRPAEPSHELDREAIRKEKEDDDAILPPSPEADQEEASEAGTAQTPGRIRLGTGVRLGNPKQSTYRLRPRRPSGSAWMNPGACRAVAKEWKKPKPQTLPKDGMARTSAPAASKPLVNTCDGQERVGGRQEALWWKRHAQLKDYKKTHGDCNVPFHFEANQKLSIWVRNQRQQLQLFRKGGPSKITQDRIESLNQLGFKWDLPRGSKHNNQAWGKMLEKLRAYKEQHGHCNVPQRFEANKTLGRWVHTQRHNFRIFRKGGPSKITQDRIESLNRLGFEWNSPRHGPHPNNQTWGDMLEKLRAYKEHHGHCNVPHRFEANKKLGIWVRRQRRSYKDFQEDRPSSMTQERINALAELGFQWTGKRGQILRSKEVNNIISSMNELGSFNELPREVGADAGDDKDVMDASTCCMDASTCCMDASTQCSNDYLGEDDLLL